MPLLYKLLISSATSLHDLVFLAALGLLAFAIAYTLLASSLNKNTVYDSFPRVGNHTLVPKFLGKSPNELFFDGYNDISKKLDCPFVVKWWARDYLILPPKYLPDLRRMKSENASFLKNFSDAVNLQHSVGSLYESDRMGEILREGMNPNLASLVPIIVEQIGSAVEKEIGHSKKWKTFKAVNTLIMISHRIVSRLLAGAELQQSEAFIHASHAFGDSAFGTGVVTAQLPVGLFRPVFSWLLSQWHKLLLGRVMQLTVPVVQRRMDEAAALGDKTPCYHDSIEWAIRLNAPPVRDAHVVSLEMLHLLEAAAGAPGALITEAMYQLLLDKEVSNSFSQELLEEIEEVIRRYGFTNEATLRMPKMDSFLMEVNRMYPVGGVTAARTVVQEPITLHDGIVLPVGTRIGFPCKAIQRDERFFRSPSEFQCWRFLDATLAQNQSRERNQHQDQQQNERQDRDHRSSKQQAYQSRYTAAMATSTNLPWGYGAHACPGRFYTIKLVKLFLMALLPNYDIEWADERVKVQRPSSFEVEGQFLPNLKQELKVRAKKEVPLGELIGGHCQKQDH